MFFVFKLAYCLQCKVKYYMICNVAVAEQAKCKEFFLFEMCYYHHMFTLLYTENVLAEPEVPVSSIRLL